MIAQKTYYCYNSVINLLIYYNHTQLITTSSHPIRCDSLTPWVPREDGHRRQTRLPAPGLVLCGHTELVQRVLVQVSYGERRLPHRLPRDEHPALRRRTAALDVVARHRTAAVLRWRLPRQRQRVLEDVGHLGCRWSVGYHCRNNSTVLLNQIQRGLPLGCVSRV